MNRYTVSVRALCEFAAKAGDLDRRFTPSPTSQQGIAGHRSVAARRSGSHRCEVPAEGAYEELVVRGRADGFDLERGWLEEVKTFSGDLDRLPDNHRALHWAQAKVYALLLCREHGLPGLTVALVYFDVLDQREAEPITQACSAAELQAVFDALCSRFLAWARQEVEHRCERDAALAAMRFPHAEFRPGQRTLAAAAYNAARSGRCLAAQAPTGIGKTLATLFPLLKACPGESLDKIFFLTAKGSGRALALGAAEALQAGAARRPLRVIELVAREKACEHPDKECHGDSCPLARGFYDRLPAARAAAVEARQLTRDALREIALAHGVCPYYLGQEVVRWCDLVVGDYNHFFDASALLHGLTLAQDWRVAVLVDEAHNLVDRARAMYSASLDPAALRAARAAAPAPLHKPIERLRRALSRLGAGDAAYEVLPELPASFTSALRDASAAIAEHLAGDAGPADRALLDFHFEALRVGQLLDSFGPHSLIDLSHEPGRRAGTTLCVRNVVPAPFLKPRWAAARASVLFSATLAPQDYYADLLGLPGDTAWIDVAAPFDAAQLSVRVVRQVSTRFADRDASLEPIAGLIAAQYAAAPGNYLAFFSSFDYLEQAAEVFAALHPQVPVWRQGRRLSEREREVFLSRFAAGGRGIGFAVLGGSFAEGIDLVGTRLIGAFIATLGLPQVNPVNEALRRRLDADFDAGFDYTYLYPGIRKVVQAAGRVIRSLSDRGSLHLIDDRFARPEVLRLLPAWWRIEGAQAPRDPPPSNSHGSGSAGP